MSDPFRDDIHGRSPTLERLASRSPEAAEILEIERVPASVRDVTLGAAIGDVQPIGCLAMVGYLAAVGVGIAWLTGAVTPIVLLAGVLAIVGGHVAHALSRAAWHRRVAARLAWVDQRPFPITGIRGYLAAARPMIDVRFLAPPLAATVTSGIRGHAPDAEVSQVDDYTFRIVLRAAPRTDVAEPVLVHADDRELMRFVDEVLVPVDADVGIASVTLGGTTTALAAPKRRG